jgi:FtsZ-interacting cell division protein ZipA
MSLTRAPKFTEPPKATVKTREDGSLDGNEEHPMVLTVVGSILGVGFVVAALTACRKSKRKKNTSHNWSRVNGEEEDDDEEFGLVDPSDRQKSSSISRRRLSNESDSDDDVDYDDDDDDEFFDSIDL